MKPLVIIPARGGSKGLPRKNIKQLGGKPLIQYTIEAAREVFPDNVICVSTDDIEIKQIVESFGLNVPFIRPSEIAKDETSTYDVLLHAINFYKSQGYYPDTLILLQVTSPFRNGNHIEEALKIFDNNCNMVVSVKETKANPYFILREENDEGWLVKSKEGHFNRRQDLPKVYELNGAIYVIDIETLVKFPLDQIKKVRKYLMDENSSIDIDDILDFTFAEIILKEGNE